MRFRHAVEKCRFVQRGHEFFQDDVSIQFEEDRALNRTSRSQTGPRVQVLLSGPPLDPAEGLDLGLPAAKSLSTPSELIWTTLPKIF